MNPSKTKSSVLSVVILSGCILLFFLAACGGGETPTPVVPPPPNATRTSTPSPTPTVTPTSTTTPSPTPTPTTILVGILNRRLTRAELVEAIRNESTLTVVGFNYAAKSAMVTQFQNWVQAAYGVEITLQYVTKETAADVIALEEHKFDEARAQNRVAEMFPSDLLSDAAQVDKSLNSAPYTIAFQSASTVAPILHNDTVGEWFHDWKDLGDPRLKRRIALPQPGSKLAGIFLIGAAYSFGKDYHDPDQMRAAIDMVCTQIVPNAYTFTNNMNELQQLLRENRIDAAVSWNLLARLERLSGAAGTEDIVYRPMTSGQPALNGYAWIPKDAAHPILAQLYINWRLSNDGQLPGAAWGISNLAWGEYHEGLLGESYTPAIPEWVKDSYLSVYPTVEQIQTLYKPVDWNYYATQEAGWMEQYGACIK